MLKPVILAASLALSLSHGAPVAAAPTAAESLRQLFGDERAAYWRADPLAATSDGEHRYDDRLPAVTPADQRSRLRTDEDLLRRLAGIRRTDLGPQDQVSRDLFAFMLQSRVTLAGHREWRMPLNSDSGFHVDVLMLADLGELNTTGEYERYIARLTDVPRYFAESADNMRVGLREGFTLPAEILPGVSRIIAGAQYARAEDAPMWRPFANFPATVPAADRQRLVAAGKAAIADHVIPAYASFQRFFENEYRPGARTTLGAAALPGGAAYYADLVRYFTTLPDATPEGIHQTGLAEVARIRAEMEQIVREVGFKGSFAEFLQKLRTDPQFYATTPEQLLREAAWIAKEIDGKLPLYFGRLPRTPYGVEPVPAALAPNYTGGRYNPGPIGLAGKYWVNTYALDTRPLYVLPALTLHEAVPGHHLQGALARELTGVPVFRLNFYPHAFGEGWALYTEKLGAEMGVYHTPYQHFGRLTYEMWRACRLVVDTGIHAMGWSRQRARDFLAANTALSEHEIGTEVDRYVAWPGQALAYKTGELRILELRRRAESRLGDRFDIRGFHDAVLENGGVTLPVLDGWIDAWIEKNAAAPRGQLR
jgi:uncharacterized protein (DUF885 family)